MRTQRRIEKNSDNWFEVSIFTALLRLSAVAFSASIDRRSMSMSPVRPHETAGYGSQSETVSGSSARRWRRRLDMLEPCSETDPGSLLRHAGLAQPGGIGAFVQRADLRYPEISEGLQASDARKAIVAALTGHWEAHR